MLRDIAATLSIIDRRAYGILTEFSEASYVITQKDGRHDRCQIRSTLW